MTDSTALPESSAGPVDSVPPMGVVLHVADMKAASRLYQSLGFVETAAYPKSDGTLAVAFLSYGSSTLILGPREELHYEHATRARQIRRGPLGLGVVLTLTVPDVTQIYETVRAAGLEVLLAPVDEFYGDRVFMFLDPDGYEWKISQTIARVADDDVAAIIASA